MGATAPTLAAELNQLLTGFWVSQAVHAAAKLGLADFLGDMARTPAEVARAAGTSPDMTQRLLRALATVALVTEDGDGRFSLTDLGRLLTEAHPQSMRALAIMIGEVGWDAWGHLTDAVRTGQTAFSLTHGQSIFPYLTRHEGKAAIFNAAMGGYVAAVAQAIPSAYDFTPFDTVADIGGGHGALLASILRAAPAAKGLLFDLPEVIATATGFLAGSGVASRCQAIPGDFFEAVPTGADAYVLASVVHDWGDEDARRILRSVRRSMGAKARLLLVELVISPGNAPDFGKWMDLQMMVIFGGRERTGDQYRSLLASAGLRLTRILPTGTPQSLLEAVPV